MHTDEIRARFLRDRVLTATPAQRVVMLYDRLSLDLTLAEMSAAADPFDAAAHLGHAMQIVAELHSSLDLAAGGPAANLDAIYGYLLRELVAARSGDSSRIAGVRAVAAQLGEAWSKIADGSAAEFLATAPAGASGAAAVAADSWVS